MIASSFHSLQGRDQKPLVRINRLNPKQDVEILTKLAFFYPTHSVKDRILVSMLDAIASNLKDLIARLEKVEERLDLHTPHTSDVHLDEQDYWEYDEGVEYSI